MPTLNERGYNILEEGDVLTRNHELFNEAKVVTRTTDNYAFLEDGTRIKRASIGSDNGRKNRFLSTKKNNTYILN